MQTATLMHPTPLRTWIFRLGMLLAVASVFLLAYVDLLREQQRALADFGSEQQAIAQASAIAIQARIETVSHDLDRYLEASHAAPPPPGGLYRDLQLVDDAEPSPGATTLQAERRQLLAELRSDGAMQMSPLLSTAGSDASLRLFGRRRGGRAALLLVDTERFFDNLPAVAAAMAAPLRWIVLDDLRHTFAVVRTDGDRVELDWHSRDTALEPEVATLLARMERDRAGTLPIGRGAAASLGLEKRLAVAGFATVKVTGQPPWAVAVVASAQRVRDRARLAAWRLGAATGLAGLLVGLFGLVVSRQQTRTQALAEALRLAEATAALRERADKLLEAMPLGVLALDGSLAVTAINPFLRERGATTGASLASALPRATAAQVEPLLSLVAEARRQARPLEKLGLGLSLEGGEPRDFDAIAIPLSRPLAETACFLVLHDRTDLRALERSLARAEKLATIGTLAAGVAHEIGTPLGIISGRAEQLLAKLPNDDGGEGTRKGLASILKQVDKVSATIRQLLDFSRVRPVEGSVVVPSMVLASAAALLEHRFRQANVGLEISAPPSLPPIAGDPAQLEQVVVNLLINAVDACAPGGTVALSASLRGDRIVLEVKDDGAGIAPEHLGSVLDPFFTTKKRGQGTGLGLTIVSDIVKNHGGSLDLASEVGRGTTVTIALPVGKEPG